MEVRRTRTPPGDELDHRIQSDKKLIAKNVHRVRYDLMPKDHEPGGRLAPFLCPEQAALARGADKRLRDYLQAEGYTVNGNTRVWHVYAIELHPRTAKAGKAGRPYVYVGATSLSVDERARQHRLGPDLRAGYKNYSKACHKHYKQLRLDLLPAWARRTFFSRCAALRAEGELRLHFEREGYRVEGGKDLFGDKPHGCGQLRRQREIERR